jgi:hypothetical protein
VTWFDGDNSEADNDCDFELIISFGLINDAESNSKKCFDFDLGNIGPEVESSIIIGNSNYK